MNSFLGSDRKISELGLPLIKEAGSAPGFSEHFFYKSPLRNCLFHEQVAEFQPLDMVKKYFKGVFQAFYTRTRSSHSKKLFYLKSLNWEELNL